MTYDAVPEDAARPTPHVFPTTHWSAVLAAGTVQSPASRAALEQLCRAYWYPLYAFVRRRGHPVADAEDLTQGFFEHLLERDSLKAARPDRGRFRSFLLTLLQHFMSDERARQSALKRGGAVVWISLDVDDGEARFQDELPRESQPERLFDRAWAQSVMRHAWHRLRQTQATDGSAASFALLSPFLARRPVDGEYTALGQRLGRSAHAVGEAVLRLRQQYRECVRTEIAHTVTTQAEVDAELRYLLEVLGVADTP